MVLHLIAARRSVSYAGGSVVSGRASNDEEIKF
jgi:hypothetical protein